MSRLQERYLTDEQGVKIAVVLSMEYERSLEALEELESIQSYDAAKALGDEAVSLEEAIGISKGNCEPLERQR